jgi:hypothetical protein
MLYWISWKRPLTLNTKSVGTKECRFGLSVQSFSCWSFHLLQRPIFGLWFTWSLFSSSPALVIRPTSWFVNALTFVSAWWFSIFYSSWIWLLKAQFRLSHTLEKESSQWGTILHKMTWKAIYHATPFHSSSISESLGTISWSVICLV